MVALEANNISHMQQRVYNHPRKWISPVGINGGGGPYSDLPTLSSGIHKSGHKLYAQHHPKTRISFPCGVCLQWSNERNSQRKNKINSTSQWKNKYLANCGAGWYSQCRTIAATSTLWQTQIKSNSSTEQWKLINEEYTSSQSVPPREASTTAALCHVASQSKAIKWTAISNQLDWTGVFGRRFVRLSHNHAGPH